MTFQYESVAGLNVQYRVLGGGASLIRPTSVCGWPVFTVYSFVLQCELMTVQYNRLNRISRPYCL